MVAPPWREKRRPGFTEVARENRTAAKRRYCRQRRGAFGRRNAAMREPARVRGRCPLAWPLYLATSPYRCLSPWRRASAPDPGCRLAALHAVSDIGITGLLGAKLATFGAQHDQGVAYTLYLMTFALDSVGDVFASLFAFAAGLLVIRSGVLPRCLGGCRSSSRSCSSFRALAWAASSFCSD